MAFKDNVFINCPFDVEYYSLLRPLVFTVIYLGLRPRIALERTDSGETRIAKIIELIAGSKYAIHDLSRIKANKSGELFRLNMPFELGLDVGCRFFKTGQAARKKCLILEAERYRYKAAISDLSGSDIGVHGNKPEEVVVEVRNWLSQQCRLKVSGPSKIWGSFTDFMADDYDSLIEDGFSKEQIDNLPISELMTRMEKWIKRHQSRGLG